MMATATLNLKVSPRRMLSLKEAADYCGLTAKRFPTECRVAPIAMPSGVRLYDMRDLDGWLDALKAGGADTDDDIIGKLG
ncbi:hypothetical protein GOA89_13060 [Sinorhizobium meliloti]|nr:hypothetical protein [Sinorhizobium meliloti]MDW9847225.1 hypothetical protein [Sinorhizobium meliloti]MDX0147778.1 hypothetical protein [Sinorhizobium meliloti]MDX0150053.1 hypothetical protein [Sinorhizobium meliloti]MDX0169232.1 hypothetical protein [Sinorhizobium meliloti]